jgi:3',5'-cyclic AMP phosphodiesterase CpdA
MLIAQISDFHMVGENGLAYGRVDTGALLGQAVAALSRVHPQPDVVIGTGDLAHSGTDGEYGRVRSFLQRLPIPFLPVAGNHDDRAAFRRAFGQVIDLVGGYPFIQYAKDCGDIRVVVIDTVTDGSDEPSFCQARTAWLDGILAASDRPTLIAMHHPPFPCGIGWLEPSDPLWAERLRTSIRRAPHVVRIIAGHVHRAIHIRWEGVPASTAPSTAHQVFPDLGDGEPLLSLEAPGFQLHRWDGVQFTTYTASTVGFADAFSPAASA